MTLVQDADFQHHKWPAYQQVASRDSESLRQTLMGTSMKELREIKIVGKNKLIMEMDFCQRVPA